MTTSNSNDTICAISTPTGLGGIAVARVSGPAAFDIVDKVWHGSHRMADTPSHVARFGRIVDPDSNELLDEAVATVFRAPKSFTGENTVEISVHGSRWIQRELINLLIRSGCRLAEAGEFTRRAFANGKMDLAEAEAVADVIASTSKAAHRVAMSQMRGQFSQQLQLLHDKLLDLSALLELELDFSEEDVEFANRQQLIDIAEQIFTTVSRLERSFSTGQALKSGVPVAIVGAPNAGKSTLLNQLLGDEKAIVSNIPGTTRDVIEDTIELEGVQFRLIDTAGLHSTADTIERLGIERAISQIQRARIVLWVVDAMESAEALKQTSAEIAASLASDATLIIALNKTDLAADAATAQQAIEALPEMKPLLPAVRFVQISAKIGTGIDALSHLLVETSGLQQWSDEIVVTNARHYQALVNARQSIERTIQGLKSALSGDFIAQDLRETLHYLGEITGSITTPDILATIFSRFCIGK
jgi:tRNA modification GTPase